MIKVIIKRNTKLHRASISMSGHAEYANHGEDIICAAASFLGITINNQLFRLNNKIKTSINDEPSLLLIENITTVGEENTLLEYFENSIKELEHENKKFVQVQTKKEA
jgi:uncharacterized protein YsxB (DUF464 family)